MMSKHHFWRLFKKLFRETIGSYIRKRKLTMISRELIHSKKEISALCEEYGFEYREAFTRAFKKQFRVTPKQYRKNKFEAYHLERRRLSNRAIDHILGGGISLAPERVNIKSVSIEGIEGAITREESVYDSIRFFGRYLMKTLKLRGRADSRFYVLVRSGDDKKGESVFGPSGRIRVFMGSEPIPGRVNKRAARMKVKSGTYAVFKHRGHAGLMENSCEYVFGNWLAKNVAKDLKSFIVRFDGMSFLNDDFEMDIMILA